MILATLFFYVLIVELRLRVKLIAHDIPTITKVTCEVEAQVERLNSRFPRQKHHSLVYGRRERLELDLLRVLDEAGVAFTERRGNLQVPEKKD